MRNTTSEFTDAELATLPLIFRNLLVACVINHNPYEVVAEQTGIPVGTVKSRINRARKRIEALRQSKASPDFSEGEARAVSR